MTKNKKSMAPTKRKFSVNPLLITVLILVLIPILILGYSIIDSTGTRGEPVVGSRYGDELVNKISDEQVEQVKAAIAVEGMESVDVTLNVATMRITVKVPGLANAEASSTICSQVYDTLNTILPIEKYFTNFEGKKSYDLEIHVYNMIPQSEEEKPNQIYSILTKTGGMSEPLINVQTNPKSEDLMYHLTHPITEEMLVATKAAVNIEGMDESEVRLVGSTVVISVRVPSLNDVGVASQMCEQVYNQMATVLPIEEYFTNRGNIARYSVEIHVYNLIPEEGSEAVQYAASLSKGSGDDTFTIATGEE